MKINSVYCLLSLAIISLCLMLTGCNKESSVTANSEKNSEAKLKVEENMLPQCQSALSTAIDMGKIESDTKTTDAICRCQVDLLMARDDVEQLAIYAEENNRTSIEFRDIIMNTMTECADKYDVKLPF